MENIKGRMFAILKRGMEAYRGWKRIWKVLVVLGVIATVAVALFFAIPNPYRDAWDDLFLPYPEEFPEPGTTGTDTSGNTITFLARGESVPFNVEPHETTAQTGIKGSLNHADAWGACDLIADIEILNYIDVAKIAYYNEEYPQYRLTCLATCKIHRIFAQRADVAHKENDVVTIEFFASSKKSIAPYPELGKGQRWLVTLRHTENSIYTLNYSGYGIDSSNGDSLLTDYVVSSPTYRGYSVPIGQDICGKWYVDTRSMESVLEDIDPEKFHMIYEMPWEFLPWDLIDRNTHKIYDMDGLSEFMKRAMDDWDEWYDAQNFPIQR